MRAATWIIFFSSVHLRFCKYDHSDVYIYIHIFDIDGSIRHWLTQFICIANRPSVIQKRVGPSCTSEASPLDISVCQESLGSNGVIFHNFGVPSYGFQICVFFGCFWIDFSRPCWYEFKWHLVVHSLQKNGDGLPCEFGVWVFFLPLINLWGLQSFVSPISQRATVVALVKNQLTIRSKQLLTREKHKVEGT